jgi:predicted RNase H-like nuclease (RuvC/YqgF family)
MKEEASGLRAAMKAEVNSLKVEMKDTEERVLHQYHITAEGLRDDIKQVAEGVMNLNEKFDREISQFRKEVAHSHEELKAMIKFSYSELDRRITALEIELENLKHRIEKIERSSSIS